MNADIETLGTIDDHPFQRILLKSEHAEVTILTLGGATQSWIVSGPNGPLDVVLGYDDPFDYLTNPDYLGTTIGRVANRISGASFELEGERYLLSKNGPGMTLHGGEKGLSRCNWRVESASDNFVQLTYFSPHLEQGFPGNVEFSLLITLAGAQLTYEITANVDRPTPINFAQHNYYNLMGGGPIWEHQMQVHAQSYAPLGEDLLPTGEVTSIEGTRFDFRKVISFAEMDPQRIGLDMAYVLPDDRNIEQPIANVSAPNGLNLRLWSDQPCLQTYNGNNQSTASGGVNGRKFGKCSAICLEPQRHSNAVNTPEFPSIIVYPDQPYHYWTRVEIS